MADLTVILTGQQAIANPTTWGTSSQYGQGYWGTGGDVIDVVALNEIGWGSDTWGTENWGQSGLAITLSGLSSTASVGSVVAFRYPGWGTLDWGENGWGSVLEAIEVPTGQQATASVGAITPADVVGLTGVSATASVPTYLDIPEQISGLGATSSIGQLSINNGADHVQGLASLAATASPGALAPADVMGLTGISGTISVGSITVASVELIDVTGVGATSSVGSISLADMIVGLSGVAGTSGVGSISPTEMAMGLTGVSATVSVGEVGGPIAWKKVTPTQGGSWSKDSPSQGGSWSKRSA